VSLGTAKRESRRPASREVSTPLEWFPRLRGATAEQRKNWRLIAKGIGIHWEEVDEDIAVSTLLRAA
jgi:hypothetical protein